MEQAERQQLKDWLIGQVEDRIGLIQQSVGDQTALYARRRDIIAVLESQVAKSLTMLESGLVRSSLSDDAVRERVSILEEVIAELKTVPEDGNG